MDNNNKKRGRPPQQQKQPKRQAVATTSNNSSSSSSSAGAEECKKPRGRIPMSTNFEKLEGSLKEFFQKQFVEMKNKLLESSQLTVLDSTSRVFVVSKDAQIRNHMNDGSLPYIVPKYHNNQVHPKQWDSQLYQYKGKQGLKKLVFILMKKYERLKNIVLRTRSLVPTDKNRLKILQGDFECLIEQFKHDDVFQEILTDLHLLSESEDDDEEDDEEEEESEEEEEETKINHLNHKVPNFHIPRKMIPSEMEERETKKNNEDEFLFSWD
jgi:hypothetical protein